MQQLFLLSPPLAISQQGDGAEFTIRIRSGVSDRPYRNGLANSYDVAAAIPAIRITASSRQGNIISGLGRVVTNHLDTGDVVTNQVDSGGVMNVPSGYYRVKFVP